MDKIVKYGPKVGTKLFNLITAGGIGYELNEAVNANDKSDKIIERLTVEREVQNSASANHFWIVVCLVILLIILMAAKAMFDYKNAKRQQAIPMRMRQNRDAEV